MINKQEVDDEPREQDPFDPLTDYASTRELFDCASRRVRPCALSTFLPPEML